MTQVNHSDLERRIMVVTAGGDNHGQYFPFLNVVFLYLKINRFIVTAKYANSYILTLMNS